jgi:3-hydroxyacyl-CoA dehydrogenase / enoyl-CoA hydratase / 3-hydroxybutyryl-CoA epimerase
MAQTVRIVNESASEGAPAAEVPGVATLMLDLPGRPLNTLTRQLFADLDEAVGKLEPLVAAGKIVGVVVASAKDRGFVAGADLFEMRDMSREALNTYLSEGQRIFGRLAALPVHTVAAIHGDCLGGGLELALACGSRVASKAPGQIGLPETKLGLVPGWGGTVRLCRLIGVGAALPMLVTGKTVGSGDALKLGIVDEVVDGDSLLAAARHLARQPRPNRPSRIEADAGRIVAETIKSSEREGANYPAVLRVIRVVEAGLNDPQAGMDAERIGLAELRETEAGKSLLRLFFLRQQARKRAADQAGAAAMPVMKLGVVGGGTMGAGIAYAALTAGLPVMLGEMTDVAADAAKGRIAEMLKKDERAGRRTSQEVAEAMDRLEVFSRLDRMRVVDLVIEAVAEDMAVKRAVFSALDRSAKAEAVLATNTSSLSVGELAASTSRPDLVVGLHFFNPVPRMPLVEIVRAPEADGRALATAVALAGRLGKTPVMVADAPGFLINRVLFPYLSEAVRVAEEGVAFDRIDAAAKRWGMPMGPLELIDTIGLDVCVGILNALSPHLGDRVLAHKVLVAAVAEKRLGRKSGRGFYRYDGDAKAGLVIDAEMAGKFATATPMTIDEQELESRLVLPMANEAARALDEGVVDSVDAIDLATVLGLGLATWRGGLARFIDTEGVRSIVAKLRELAGKHGGRFAPAPLLSRLAESGGTLASARPKAAVAAEVAR